MGTGSTGAVLDAIGRPRLKGSFKKGGMVKSTGAYKLHKGERVIPKKNAVKIGALMRAK